MSLVKAKQRESGTRGAIIDALRDRWSRENWTLTAAQQQNRADRRTREGVLPPLLAKFATGD